MLKGEKVIKKKFLCKKCGNCCKNLKNSNLYLHLHNGDGICFYYDKVKKLCTIYEKRPLICDVDRMFEAIYSKYYSRIEYYRLNHLGCIKLKKEE